MEARKINQHILFKINYYIFYFKVMFCKISSVKKKFVIEVKIILSTFEV